MVTNKPKPLHENGRVRIKDKRTKARVLFHYETRGMEWTMRRYDIGRNTVLRMQQELDTDPELREALDAWRLQIDESWKDGISLAASKILERIQVGAEQLDLSNPKAFEMVLKAWEILEKSSSIAALEREQKDSEIVTRAAKVRIESQEEADQAFDDQENGQEEEDDSHLLIAREQIQGQE